MWYYRKLRIWGIKTSWIVIKMWRHWGFTPIKHRKGHWGKVQPCLHYIVNCRFTFYTNARLPQKVWRTPESSCRAFKASTPYYEIQQRVPEDNAHLEGIPSVPHVLLRNQSGHCLRLRVKEQRHQCTSMCTFFAVCLQFNATHHWFLLFQWM